ncbi:MULTISPECIES: radical SAM/SPASM domain-containing protein [Nocardia]|uniref:Radical SAM family protein n=1 Tax=Nocardia ignorata TaxID=145285 RepID=A0A4V3CPM4_NOCIG|nr:MULTISPECIES: radical SAM/SPASM domain-containing protein [Nocardia]TDP38522.1 radical SAM family protein [Nocardia ignorata]
MTPLPNSVQTSPYLTRVDPRAPSPVRYFSDTFGPTSPDNGTPTEGAVFGIVGLDRRIDWHTDPRMLELLIASARQPLGTAELAHRFGADLVAEAAARHWIQPPEQLCRDYRLVSGEIEVTAHCNWGCRSCPVAVDPKPRQTMPMDLFTEIIVKLVEHGSIDYVTFQFFNEPTLDRYFTDRIEVLARYGMPLALYTNASALTGDKIETLRRSGVLRTMVVNLPSDDPAEFADLTGSASYAHSTRNVEAALAAGLPVQIGVNGVGERLALNLDGVARRYLPLGAQVTANLMCDRAGDVGGEFAQNLLIDGPLTGCGYPVHHASFSVGGDLFLCCNDYYQRERFANIGEGSIHELMTSDAAVTARRKVFGVAVAEDDFVCRRCHNQTLDFACRDFRPIATFG